MFIYDLFRGNSFGVLFVDVCTAFAVLCRRLLFAIKDGDEAFCAALDKSGSTPTVSILS